MYDSAIKLFEYYIDGMAEDGWTCEKSFGSTYILTDKNGSSSFVGCHVEGYLDSRVNVFMKIEESLCPVGTLLKRGNDWEIYDNEGVKLELVF